MGAGASASGDDSDCSPPRLSPSRSLAGLGGDSEQQRVLKLQAQAHWHRMILHANSMSKLHQPQQEQLHLVDRNDLAATAYSSSNQEAIEGREEAGFNNINKKGDNGILESEHDLEIDDFDKALESRLAPLDEATIISRSNSDIVLKRSPSGDPLPIMDRVTRSPSIKSSKSSSTLQVDESNLKSPQCKRGRSYTSSLVSCDSPSQKAKSISSEESFGRSLSHEKHQPMSSDCLRAISLLPPVRVDLRSRTGSSLSLVWDSDMEALISLRKVYQTGEGLIPRYEITYREADLDEGNALYDLSIQHNISKEWNSLVLIDPSKTSGTIDELKPNTLYAVRCRRMQWGEDWGVTLTVRTGPGPPSAVTNLHAKEVSSSSILVAWDPSATDNGLPVINYTVRQKKLGSDFQHVYKGKERLFLAMDLQPNSVYIFEVAACNRIGPGLIGDRLATRTLQPGAPAMTPWMSVIDFKTGKLFYKHPKSEATAWELPKGSVLDNALSLKNKMAYLKERIKTMQFVARQKPNSGDSQLKLDINRSNILEESLGFLRLSQPDELFAAPVKVSFRNEVGVDGGGLSREWAVEVIRALVNSSSGLLKMEDNGSGAIIDVRAEVLHGAECRWLFSAIAKFFAKAIIDGLVLGVRFSRLFLSWVAGLVVDISFAVLTHDAVYYLGKHLTLSDLRSLDSSMYRGLQWVLDNDVTDMDLTFSASFELLDSQRTVNLVPDGDSRTVTEENKREYVDLMMSWLIRGRFEPAVTHFVETFHSILPADLFSHFSLEDIQLLVSGSSDINVSSLKSNACYTGGYGEETPQVQWFWEILMDEFSSEEVSQVVAFVTGCPSVPHAGLKPPLTITMLERGTSDGNESSGDASESLRDSILPRSHTCFHQIVIPLYSSKSVMQEKLLYALKNSEGGGFHLA